MTRVGFVGRGSRETSRGLKHAGVEMTRGSYTGTYRRQGSVDMDGVLISSNKAPDFLGKIHSTIRTCHEVVVKPCGS